MRPCSPRHHPQRRSSVGVGASHQPDRPMRPHAADDRQLRFIHLQPGAVLRRARRRRARVPQRRDHARRHHRAEARAARALARPVLAGRGRHLRRGDPGLRRQAADPGRVPGPPGDRRGARRQGDPRADADARQDQRDHDRRARRVHRAAARVHRDPLPLAGDRARDAARPCSRSRRPRRTARSWACGTASSRARRRRSKACSSIPNRS